MRLERLTYNKIKVFLTFDDLLERGLTKEDLWQDAPKVQQLFQDMMDEASIELGFEVDGPLAVEVYSLQAQGMVVIVTKEGVHLEDDDDFLDEYIEMQVTVDESLDIFYEFNSFEDVISLSNQLIALEIEGGSLYFFQNHYYLLFQDSDITGRLIDDVIPVLAEFGNSATVTIYRVCEYGKEIMSENAVKQIYTHFIKNQ
ncbi:genetic competence negative regulator [Bacillus suaedaesalsae]|uniref:Adapter protein MecA n=1 Tax=Bacillus suaedaesalsae TaxID=2810349 RepID=A0ABS2DN12_9BACI|nr:genetic competence negative regulator [Bacillus suaedaesalsae]MBM6619894.1 genetic competence negative regulator [Bacillus suaedaesalsae]